jgi:hypothetical protein
MRNTLNRRRRRTYPTPTCTFRRDARYARFAPRENVRDVTFHEDTVTSRTGNGPVNLATIRAAVIAAIKDAGYLHIPEGRRDHTTPTETLHLHSLD